MNDYTSLPGGSSSRHPPWYLRACLFRIPVVLWTGLFFVFSYYVNWPILDTPVLWTCLFFVVGLMYAHLEHPLFGIPHLSWTEDEPPSFGAVRPWHSLIVSENFLFSHLLPVFKDDIRHMNQTFVVTFLFILAYAYLAIYPPLFMYTVCEAVGAPKWLMRFTAGLAIMLPCQMCRCVFVRRLLFCTEEDEIRAIFNDATLMEGVTGNHHSWLLMLGQTTPVVCIMLILFLVSWDASDTMLMIPVLMPAFTLAGLMNCGAYAVVALTEISHCLANNLCEKLKNPNAREKDRDFWEQITQEQIELDRKIDELWKFVNGGRVLCADLLSRVMFTAAIVLVGVGSKTRLPQALAGLIATGSVLELLHVLYPIAVVNGLCRDENLNLCSKFANHPDMGKDGQGSKDEAQAAHGRFMHFLTVTTAGIELPVVGIVTVDLLSNALVALGTVWPLILTYSLQLWGHSVPTECPQ